MSDVFDTNDQGGESEKKSALDALVGEGKKFATVEDLAAGKMEADQFIEQLKNENLTVREQITKLEESKDQTGKIEELLKAVREAKQDSEEGNQSVSEDDLSKKIKEIMQGVSAEATAKQNRELGNKLVLAKAEGNVEAAKALLADRAKELGMSKDSLRELSESSPSAFAKLMEIDPSTVSSGVSKLKNEQGGGEVTGQRMEIDGHHTKAYYDQLKKEIGPAKFWNDHRIQGKYTQDAMALGERFNQ